MNALSEEQVGWVAGLIEGEGSISAAQMSRPRVSDGVRRAAIRVTVTQADESIIDRLLAWTGLGHKWGPRQSKQFPNAKPTYWWMVQKGHEVDELICLIWHLLSDRRQGQALASYKRWVENL